MVSPACHVDVDGGPSSSSRCSTGGGEFKGDRGWHVLLNKSAE